MTTAVDSHGTPSTQRSERAAGRRQQLLPHGVTGDGRGEDTYPIVFSGGEGQWLYDIDGNEFLDLHGGYATAILGYANRAVDTRVVQAIQDGRCFVGVAHEHEARLAERLCTLLPEAERVALCGGGGTDSVYHAVRLSRAATGRTKLIKLEGGYHGWHETVGASTRPQLEDPAPVPFPPTISNSVGSLSASVEEILVANANDVTCLEGLFERHRDEVAALIVEPIVYSMGCVQLDDEYLRRARELCDRYGSILIFDEIMSGFRSSVGGVAAELGIVPDLGVYGKAIANGYMMSALAGRADLIDQLAPGGSVFYSGTFNGHPLSVAAAEATLDELQAGTALAEACARTARLATSLNGKIEELGVRAVCQQHGTIFNLYLNSDRVASYRDLARSAGPDTLALNRTLRLWLRDRGIFMQRRPGTNRCFISTVHRDQDVERITEALEGFLDEHADQIES